MALAFIGCIVLLTIIDSISTQKYTNPSILQDSRDLPQTDGAFGFLYRTEDGIAHGAVGEPGGKVHGRFTYTDPTGLKVNFNYNAGTKTAPGYNYEENQPRQQTQSNYNQPRPQPKARPPPEPQPTYDDYDEPQQQYQSHPQPQSRPRHQPQPVFREPERQYSGNQPRHNSANAARNDIDYGSYSF